MKTETSLSKETKKQIAEELAALVHDNRIPCARALGLAKKLNVPSRDIGQVADELKIKICKCQLGCF